MDAIAVGNRRIGPGNPCFIIAEAGINHNGSLDKARKMVDAAKRAGADAIKFQLYRAEEQVSHVAPTAKYQKKQTGSEVMIEMAKSYDLPWDAHREIFKLCREIGIIYMSSCFDPRAVDFLLQIGGEAIKIASGEITNYPLLAYAAATERPIILSTGMCTLQDVAGAVDHIRANGKSPLALMHCVSNYPSAPGTINLRAMQTLAEAFGVPVGYSDHTLGNAVSVAAVSLGARIIEKHFTLDKTLPGPDHAMSLDPMQLQSFVEAIRIAETALGSSIKAVQPGEEGVRKVARRSLVSRRRISAGERLDEDNVTLKRPASGIDPRLWKAVRGRKANADIEEDVPVTWEMLE